MAIGGTGGAPSGRTPRVIAVPIFADGARKALTVGPLPDAVDGPYHRGAGEGRSMTEHFDARETRSPADREASLFAELPRALHHAIDRAPGWAARLRGIDVSAVTSREALAGLPVTRKADLIAAQREHPPFGGFLAVPPGRLARVFVSPGPVLVPQGPERDAWGAARALFAAGVRPGELAANTFGYHMTPGAFILESGLEALGCPILAAGPGNAEQQLAAFAALRPALYCGVPDYLNILLDKAQETGTPIGFTRALVSGAALPADLRARIEARGVRVFECYATADLGVVAYESEARDGLIVNEDLILEIVRPGTGEPVERGEVGEVVVTRLGATCPMIRLATGDLSAVMPGSSGCGRTNQRIRGWLGRADQRTKVKGMFVDPAQVEAVRARHPGIVKARLVITRAGHVDAMTLRCEGLERGAAEAVAATLKAVTGLAGTVEAAPVGSLPDDGKVIADERPLER